MKRAENFIPYGYREIFGVIKERVFNAKPKMIEGSDICSESTQFTSLAMGMKSFTPERIKRSIITPQDFFRFYLPEEYTLKYKD